AFRSIAYNLEHYFRCPLEQEGFKAQPSVKSISPHYRKMEGFVCIFIRVRRNLTP
ncbi:hypothetical protein LINPERHAP2_LOCUS32079, partial [Linum perenne]